MTQSGYVKSDTSHDTIYLDTSKFLSYYPGVPIDLHELNYMSLELIGDLVHAYRGPLDVNANMICSTIGYYMAIILVMPKINDMYGIHVRALYRVINNEKLERYRKELIQIAGPDTD
jgi:hypothetical protein